MALLHSLRNREKMLQEMLWDPWRRRGLKTACACDTQIDTCLNQEDFARGLLLLVGTFSPGHHPKFPGIFCTETSEWARGYKAILVTVSTTCQTWKPALAREQKVLRGAGTSQPSGFDGRGIGRSRASFEYCSAFCRNWIKCNRAKRSRRSRKRWGTGWAGWQEPRQSRVRPGPGPFQPIGEWSISWCRVLNIYPLPGR